jgi:phytoene dehydrogenase-like protein
VGTRREFLQGGAALAAGLAFPACASKRRPVRGAIAGQSDARGHLLRERSATGAVARREELPLAILGGGIAGLSCAWRLARAGVGDFALLELEDQSGGTSIAGRNEVCEFPWGAHYLPVPTREQRAVCELLAELDLARGFAPDGRLRVPETALVRDPKERLFFAGAWSEGLYCHDGASPGDLGELQRFEERVRELAARRGRDGRRWFAIPLEHSSRDPEALALDALSMAQWLAREGFESERLRWYVEYGCRDDFGCALSGTSAWAGLHYFAARWTDGGSEPAEFLAWPEGNAFLARHLARAAEGRVRCGQVVLAIEPRGERVLVRALETRSGALVEYSCARVVCALPRFVARRLLEGLGDAGFATSPWVVANLTLRARPGSRGFPACWDNVLRESESLGYVVATHQQDRDDERSVWTWYRPFTGADARAERERVLAARWEDWRDAVLGDLERAHLGLGECVEAIDVWRWGHAMVRPEPGFVWSAARQAAARPRGRVHFAHTDLSAMALFEEAQWHGVRAAEEVLKAQGRTFDSWL